MIDRFILRCSGHTDADVQVFGVYFEQYYCHRPEEWALGLRGIFVSTTTMSLEAFHKILKHNSQFMDGKFNQRLDKLFQHLYDYMAEMKHRHLKTSAAQRVTNKTSNRNFKDHKAALLQSFSAVSPIEGGWCVQSFTEPGVNYTVKRTGFSCNHVPCLCASWDCGICYHQFICTCPRVINSHGRETCKHSHLVQM